MKKINTINCLDQFLSLFRGTTTKKQIEDLIEYMIKSSFYIHPDKVANRNSIIENIIENQVQKKEETYCNKNGGEAKPNETLYRYSKKSNYYDSVDGNPNPGETLYREKSNSYERVKDNLLPVRWSSARDIYIFENGKYKKVNKDRINSKKASIEYQKEKTLYYKYKDKNNQDIYLPVDIDSDGNQWVVSAIKEATGHTVSRGKNSTISNATISHIWGNATDPLYFTGLWNIVIIPTFCNFILDKEENDDSSTNEKKYQDIINKVNWTFQAVCYKLYNVGEIKYLQMLKPNEPKKKYMALAEKYIKLIPEDHILASWN